MSLLQTIFSVIPPGMIQRSKRLWFISSIKLEGRDYLDRCTGIEYSLYLINVVIVKDVSYEAVYILYPVKR